MVKTDEHCNATPLLRYILQATFSLLWCGYVCLYVWFVCLFVCMFVCVFIYGWISSSGLQEDQCFISQSNDAHLRNAELEVAVAADFYRTSTNPKLQRNGVWQRSHSLVKCADMIFFVLFHCCALYSELRICALDLVCSIRTVRIVQLIGLWSDRDWGTTQKYRAQLAARIVVMLYSAGEPIRWMSTRWRT